MKYLCRHGVEDESNSALAAWIFLSRLSRRANSAGSSSPPYIYAEAFLKSLPELRIRLADPPSYEDVFRLAERSGLTVYDGAYLDLAARERLPLAVLTPP